MFATRVLQALVIVTTASFFCLTGHAAEVQNGVLILPDRQTGCLANAPTPHDFKCNANSVRIFDFNSKIELFCAADADVFYEAGPFPKVKQAFFNTAFCKQLDWDPDLAANNAAMLAEVFPAEPDGHNQRRVTFIWSYDRNTQAVKVCAFTPDAQTACKDLVRAPR